MEPWRKWLRECSRDPMSPARQPGSLGMLTGTDAAALSAIDACWQLYPLTDQPQEVIAAVRALLGTMQPKCRPFARELIARALDWADRELLWVLVNDPELPARQEWKP